MPKTTNTLIRLQQLRSRQCFLFFTRSCSQCWTTLHARTRRVIFNTFAEKYCHPSLHFFKYDIIHSMKPQTYAFLCGKPQTHFPLQETMQDLRTAIGLMSRLMFLFDFAAIRCTLSFAAKPQTYVFPCGKAPFYAFPSQTYTVNFVVKPQTHFLCERQ